MSGGDRDYESAELIVHWRPALCLKCGACHDGLPLVFDPDRRPWVDLSQASAAEVVAQVQQCPKGALTFERK